MCDQKPARQGRSEVAEVTHWLLAVAAHGYFYNQAYCGSLVEWITAHTVEGQAPPVLIGAWRITEDEYRRNGEKPRRKKIRRP